MSHDRINGIESAIQIDRGNQRLKRTRKNRRLLLAPRLGLALSEADVVAEIDVSRKLGQGLFVHDGGAHFGELAFVRVRESFQEADRKSRRPGSRRPGIPSAHCPEARWTYPEGIHDHTKYGSRTGARMRAIAEGVS